MKGANPMRQAKADKRFPLRTAGGMRRAARRSGLAALAALLFLSPAFAGWQEQATPRDVERLGRLAESRARGLEEASRAAPADRAAIRSVLDAATVAVREDRLVGLWRCRTLKLGGMTPAVVYGWFRCRISHGQDGLVFEKLSGSQRTSGVLYANGDGLVYLGASYVTAYGQPEKKPVYSGNGASAGAAATPDDQIGLFSMICAGRARLELPYPVQESTFDVIELKR